MKRLLLALALLLAPSFALAQCNGVFPANTVCGNPTGSPNTARAAPVATFQGSAGGTNGQIQYNNSSTLGGFTASQDCTINTTTGLVTCLRTNNVLFGPLATATVTQTKTLFWPSVMDVAYGAKCDGATNDAAAINAALTANAGGTVLIPGGVNCLVTSQLSIPSNTKVIGYGATITKGASIDMITMAGGSWLEGLILAGNGGSFTGAAIVITAGNDQKLFNIQCSNFVGFCVDVNNDVGLRLAIIQGFYQRTTTTNPAIRFAGSGGQETNGDRVVAFVFCGGGWLIDTAGSQNTILHSNDCINFTSGVNSAKTIVTGNRWATVGADITLNGTQHNVTGNVIAGGITLASGLQNTTIGPNTFAVGSLITDSSGQTNNRYYNETTWTPTLRGSTAAGAPTYTVQVGSYEIINRQVTVRFNITTTALGAPTGNMQIGGLPYTSANVANDFGTCAISQMSGVTLDASYVSLSAVILPNTAVVSLVENGSGQSVANTTVAKFGAATVLTGWCVYHI